MSLPTDASKSLFHVFYLGYPHKLYTIFIGVPCGIMHFSGRARPLPGCWRNSFGVNHTPDICNILEGTPIVRAHVYGDTALRWAKHLGSQTFPPKLKFF